MKKIIFVFLTILLSLDAWCQDNSQNQSTTLSDNSRFEIIQSELAVKLTFKIDKFNGKVYLLVQSGKDLTWQLMYIEKQDNDFYKIYYIDRLGNKDFINVSYDWIKRTIEIFEPLEYMKKEFIEVIFKL